MELGLITNNRMQQEIAINFASAPFVYTHNLGRNIITAYWVDSAGWSQNLMVKNISVNEVQVSDTGTGTLETIKLIY